LLQETHALSMMFAGKISLKQKQHPLFALKFNSLSLQDRFVTQSLVSSNGNIEQILKRFTSDFLSIEHHWIKLIKLS